MGRSARILVYALLSLLAMVVQIGSFGQTPDDGSAASGTPNANRLVIPKGTEVRLVLLQTLSSETPRNGQKVHLAIAKDVTVNGVLAIPKGTPATGIVKRLKKAVPDRKNGFLEVEPSDLSLPDGSSIALRLYPPGEEACGDMGPCWALYTLFGPFAVAGKMRNSIENGKHREPGEDKVLPASQEMFGYTARTVTMPIGPGR
jgi:hypothetical protein